MKSNQTDTNCKNGFTSFCGKYGGTLVRKIQKAKQDLLSQFRELFAGQEQLLRLALNEAEALAFLSDYPHLLFPTLAMEKVQGAAAWRNRQGAVETGTQRLVRA